MIIDSPTILSKYIIKNIFRYFFLIFFGLFFLFFIVQFLDVSDYAKNVNNGFKIAFKVVFFQIPSFLENILHFIIFLSGLFTFYKFSNTNEIVIIRSSGKSIFSMLKFPIFVFFFFGIFIITVYNSVSTKMNSESKRLDLIYFHNETEDTILPKNGLWFRQKNFDDGGDIIIRANRVYKDTLLFTDVVLFYVNNNKFIKRINVSTFTLEDNYFIATDNYILKENEEIEFIKEMKIKTSLSKDFVIKTIEKNYESVNNVSFWKIKSVIKGLKESGFDTLNFRIRYYYLLTIPFLFPIMILISAYFGIVNARDRKKYISIIKGIIVGFIIYISHNLITEFSIMKRLSIFDASIFFVLFYVILSIILTIKRDYLSNI